MAPIKQSTSHISDTEQVLLNKSRDDEFDVLAVEGLSYNPVSGNLERVSDIQGNSSLELVYTGSVLTSIKKAVGGVTYTKTLTYDGSGVLTDVSEWV